MKVPKGDVQRTASTWAADHGKAQCAERREVITLSCFDAKPWDVAQVFDQVAIRSDPCAT